MAQYYNPLENNFVTYENVEVPKVEITFPTIDSPIDISDWAETVTPNGNIIVKNNLPKMGTPSQNIYQVEEYSFNEEPSFKEDLKDKRKEAVEFFKSKKDSNGNQILTDYQIAGLLGNIDIESGGFKINAKNPSSGAYGYAQWLGSRKKELFNKYGNNPTSKQQLEFIWEELVNNEGGRNALQKLINSSSIEEATNIIMLEYERPSKREMAQSISKRIKSAKSFLS